MIDDWFASRLAASADLALSPRRDTTRISWRAFRRVATRWRCSRSDGQTSGKTPIGPRNRAGGYLAQRAVLVLQVPYHQFGAHIVENPENV